MSDRLAEIKAALDERDVFPRLGWNDVLWLVAEVERLEFCRTKEHEAFLIVSDDLRTAKSALAALRERHAVAQYIIEAVRDQLDASEPRPVGGQQVSPPAENWAMTPSTRKAMRRLLRDAPAVVARYDEELAALREQRCETCQKWDECGEDGQGMCEFFGVHLRADFGCSAWARREP